MHLALVAVEEVLRHVGQCDLQRKVTYETPLNMLHCRDRERTHLTRHRDLLTVLQSHRTARSVGVVKNDRYTSLCYSCLAPFVNELLLILCTHLYMSMMSATSSKINRTLSDLFHVGDTKYEAYSVQNIALS